MDRVLGNLERGLVVVISAPAGTGKTTLVRMLCKEFPCVAESISYTTRAIRKNEVAGDHYYFISEKEFEAKIQQGEFLEHAKVFNHYYGTSRLQVEAKQKEGKHVVLVIDTQGALQLMGSYFATFIFIKPPSIDELRRRLQSRRADTIEAIEERLSWAATEMSLSDRYDYTIVNQNLDVAYSVLRSILIAEEHKNA